MDRAKQLAKHAAVVAKAQAYRKRAAKMALHNKEWFPNEIMYHLPWADGENRNKNILKLRCAPHMSKPELANWIELGYDTPVKKVNTINREGQIQRNTNPRWGRLYYKRPDFKIAYVILEGTWDEKEAIGDSGKD